VEIIRDLATQRQRRTSTPADLTRFVAKMERHLDELRKSLDPAEFAAIEAQFRKGLGKLSVQVRKSRRRPGESGMPALVEPPRGPVPLAGGAAAPLEFDS
jgi:hypothetical protein